MLYSYGNVVNTNGRLLKLVTSMHERTGRNYLQRMKNSKVGCMKIARRFDKKFWDGYRKYGYGGYVYDGRWRNVAKKLLRVYGLRRNAKILEVGCGKGYLLYELKRLLPNSYIVGFDISRYAIKNAKYEVKNNLFIFKAQDIYPFKDKYFDLVISMATLHNLCIYELKAALGEIERVGKSKYVSIESYRNEKELFNLQCWALTCESFFNPREWMWIFNESKYRGDYEFIYFKYKTLMITNVYAKMKIFHFKSQLDLLTKDKNKIVSPIHVRIKPTNLCNHNCWYCSYRMPKLQLGKNMKTTDYIPKQKIVEIICDLKEMGVKAVTFSGGGEPFCYP